MAYADPEKQREYSRKYYEANAEKKREYDRQYYKANREKVRERNRKYYKANREKERERNRKRHEASPETDRENRYLRHFNITIEEYDLLLKEQGGACAICLKPPAKMRLAVDHCHKTGLIRGLTCFICNRGLGYWRDMPELCRAAAEYLEVPPAIDVIGERYGVKGPTKKRKRKRK